MTATTSSYLGQIHALLAERGYEVSEIAANTLKIREVDIGVAVQAVLEGDICFFSLICTVVPNSKITADVMRQMLDAGNQEELVISADDNWLLMALKKARLEEKNHAKNGG